ncbi:MAG TPA: hypothetical protein VFX03_00640, partial [Thermomicrobiales bacterium]|nr:hypothetical protein [Thermomicrobiales bacterium]
MPLATIFARSTAAFAPGQSSNGSATALPWPERRLAIAAFNPGAASLPAAPADRAAPERGDLLAQLRPVWALAIAVAALIAGWAIVALAFPQAQLDIPAPRAQLGAEAAVASITFFCAVVLVLFVAEGIGQR